MDCSRACLVYIGRGTMNLKRLMIIIVLLVASPAWAGSGLTGPQKNAVRSAKAYLNYAPFSKRALIHQLSSKAGSGYSVSTAKAAVNSLNVDWDKQAARAAKAYVHYQGYSCRNLIYQLSSQAGSEFTKAQATYGAKQTSACH